MDWPSLAVYGIDVLDIFAYIVIFLNLVLFVLLVLYYKLNERRNKEFLEKKRKFKIEQALKSIKGETGDTKNNKM